MQRRTAMGLIGSLSLLTAGNIFAQITDLNDAINKAGRQRMLSQRMAKFYLANAMQVDPKGSTAEIAKARSEFLAAQETLRNAPEVTSKIKEELALADAQWIFFDQGLQRLDGVRSSPKMMSDVFVSSENLLSVMDRITGLYTNIKA